MPASADSPRVSVICIFYNADRFLREAIDSVLAQTMADFEILLVDDGSTDDSGAIAQQFAAAYPGRISCLAHPGHENRGMSASRNLGLAHAAGDYIAFIDADDAWRRSKLEDQVALLEKHLSAGMVCGTVNYWNSWNGGQDYLVSTGPVSDALATMPDLLLAIYPLGKAAAPCPSDLLIRRSTIDVTGGFEDSFTGLYEDQAFCVKAYLAAPVYFASNVWLDYRQHDGSAVATAHRTGTYTRMRLEFLDWLAAHVAASEFAGKAQVLKAVRRERWLAHHPLVARTYRRLAKIAGPQKSRQAGI